MSTNYVPAHIYWKFENFPFNYDFEELCRCITRLDIHIWNWKLSIFSFKNFKFLEILFFFARWVPIRTLGLRPTGPLPITLESNPLHWGPRCRSASPLLFVPDPSWQSPRSASLPFPTSGFHIECALMFPFLHRISCSREFLLSSSCAAYTADWYARLGALPTFCNVSCPVYLWTEHICVILRKTAYFQ